jgi:hypothetical protein
MGEAGLDGARRLRAAVNIQHPTLRRVFGGLKLCGHLLARLNIQHPSESLRLRRDAFRTHATEIG